MPSPGGAKLTNRKDVEKHRVWTGAVHQAAPDCNINLQINHFGAYALHDKSVSPSAVKSSIIPFTPREMTSDEVEECIDEHVRCAVLAREAGYDGVELFGYLLTGFLGSFSNLRTDRWGGSFENRMRFPLEVVRRVREAMDKNFVVMYRVGCMELADNGNSWEEVVIFAKLLERAGADIINTHFTRHESAIPSIATMVPRAVFSKVTGRLKRELSIPVIASNRINTPEVAEAILADGDADVISMARPMLADPEFSNKAKNNRADEINTCIACNQACLDHAFVGKVVSCLVNPRACHETELNYLPTSEKRNIAVVGAGPGGLAFATVAAARGHQVTIYEAASEIGGLFNLAKRVPGKEEFHETLRYYSRQIELLGVDLKLNHYVEARELASAGYDEVIVATGLTPRVPEIEGIDHYKVVYYDEVLTGQREVGKYAAIIGAGGIGFDVAEFISSEGPSSSLDREAFAKEWGIDFKNHPRGGVEGVDPVVHPSSRDVTMLQRKSGRFGKSLGKTTGWAHMITLTRRGVKMLAGAEYIKIDDNGLHVLIEGNPRIIDVDSVIICAGQESKRDLYNDLEKLGIKACMVGGSDQAFEVDAARAIDQASRLAAREFSCPQK